MKRCARPGACGPPRAGSGFSTNALYKRRDHYEEFAERWEEAEAEAKARLPGLLVAASLAAFEGDDGDRPARRARLPKVNVDQAIRISAMEERRQRSAAGPARRGGKRPKTATNAEVRAALTKALVGFGERVGQSREEKLASGWIELGDGTMIPPGWAYVGTCDGR